jgi:uncharacterized membrane protein YhaH (DUF805 family)
MTDPLNPSTETGASARWTILAIAGVQALFFLYAIYYVIQRINPKGGGFELVAIGPMAMIFLAFVVPALMMGFNKREAMKIPAILCLLGVAANFIVWGQIVSEFAQIAAR